MQGATIDSADDKLVLRTQLYWDEDALPLCESLARRYVSLGFDGHFQCEGTWPDFTVSSHSDGREVYCVNFAAQFRAFILDQHSDNSRQCLIFYPRSRERDAAAADFGLAWTGPLLARPPVAGGWRRSDHEAEAGVCFLRASGDGTATAIVFDKDRGEGHVLSSVDAYGDYRSSETLGLEDLRAKFPELANEFGRTPDVVQMETDPLAHARGPDGAGDVPF